MSAFPALNRRQFLQQTTAAAVGVAVSSPRQAEAVVGKIRNDVTGLVDSNVMLSRWPFRRLPLDETPALVARLRQQGVVQAWAGSFDTVFHKDLATANARLAEECRRHGRGRLIPFGSVNVALPDWEEELRRCHEVHRMPGLRLFPNYHGYELEDPAFARLLARAAERGLLIQVALSLEDERMQPRLARVPHVEVKPLSEWLGKLPGLRIELLNWQRALNLGQAAPLAAAGVYFDIATVEGVGGMANLIEKVGESQVLFGSFAPLFYFESARLKLKESLLSEKTLRAVGRENARRLIPGGQLN